MTTENINRIQEFFSAYAMRFQQALNGADDIDGTAAAFAECFIEANPAGVNCGSNDENFKSMIPRGNEFYRSIGTKEMKVASVESNSIDGHHFTAKVGWHSVYERKDGKQVTIDFTVIYLLKDYGDALKIFAYITGDEQKVLKEHGLI